MESLILKNNETPLRMPVAYKAVTARTYNLSVCWRHATSGLKGVYLETIMCGGARCTSVEAVKRFFEAVTEASNKRPSVPSPSGNKQSQSMRSESARKKAIERSKKALAAAGIS